jgi:hypothetical protein
MADPICRWRNPYKDTIIELINTLPKQELDQPIARDIVIRTTTLGNFYRTPYQLACQVGLYYESGARYFPKFTYTPSRQEVEEYMTNWIIRYCIPNPYTRGFQNIQSCPKRLRKA